MFADLGHFNKTSIQVVKRRKLYLCPISLEILLTHWRRNDCVQLSFVDGFLYIRLPGIGDYIRRSNGLLDQKPW